MVNPTIFTNALVKGLPTNYTSASFKGIESDFNTLQTALESMCGGVKASTEIHEILGHFGLLTIYSNGMKSLETHEDAKGQIMVYADLKETVFEKVWAKTIAIFKAVDENSIKALSRDHANFKETLQIARNSNRILLETLNSTIEPTYIQIKHPLSS